MFERYTEKARRVIFFGRYEASNYGTPTIETEHLLLGILREDKHLTNKISITTKVQEIKAAIDGRFPPRPKIATSVDLPLSTECKQVLTDAAIEADELGHKHIGTEHLLLGILRNQSFTTELLQQHGVNRDDLRSKMAGAYESRAVVSGEIHVRRSTTMQETVAIHGSAWNADYIRDEVQKYKTNFWHWQLRPWVSLDVVMHRASGKFSFDLTLAEDAINFELVREGWKQERCAICRWTIFTSDDPAHASGYTNGRNWLCIECYTKFFIGSDFFSSNHPEIT
jgi:ATP-dependent Clp protease ATP-binding subunit ClpA